LRQFKIVKPTRQLGEKQTSFKNQSCLSMLYERQTYQQKKYEAKCRTENNDKIN
jgi:hypothetical protein